MARPKLGSKKRVPIHLTVNAETKYYLRYIAGHYGKSASALIEEWVAKEVRKIEKRTYKRIPPPTQEDLFSG